MLILLNDIPLNFLPNNLYQLVGFLGGTCGVLYVLHQGLLMWVKAWKEVNETKTQQNALSIKQVADIFVQLDQAKTDIADIKMSGAMQTKESQMLNANLLDGVSKLEARIKELGTQFTTYLMGHQKPD